MITRIGTQVSNFTATTGSDNPRTFTVTHANTGSGNSPNISRVGASFGSPLSFDGTNQLGADDPHLITIDGVKFEISNEFPPGRQTAGSIQISASAPGGGSQITNAQFWNNVTAAMNTGLADYTVGYSDNGNSTATFTITANQTGSIHNTTIATTASSFTSVSPSISGGVDGFTGVVHDDNIRMYNTATSDFRFHIDLSGTILNVNLVSPEIVTGKQR